MKKGVLIIILFLVINPIFAEVTVIDNNIYATEDDILVHCGNGQFKELLSLSQNEISYIFSKKAFNPIKVEGKIYLNLTTASQKLLADGSYMYLVPKKQTENIGTNIGTFAVKEYVYNGSEDEMKRHTYNRYYVQNAIGKTENLVGTFQSPSISTWGKIRSIISAFGY